MSGDVVRVLITGGAGFIGQHLARELGGSGAEVVALDLLKPQVHQDPQASRRAFPGEVLTLDVADPATWSDPRLRDLDAIVHLAAETGTAQSMYEQRRYRRANVTGTRLAGEAAATRGIPLVSMSSRAVYGEGRYRCADGSTTYGRPADPAGAIPLDSTEADEHHPVSVYGETKSEAEAALREHCGTVPVTTIRPQNVIGPGQALHNPYTGVLAAFLARLREGRPLTVYGDGSATRDFVHVHDLVRLLTWCLEHSPEPGSMRVLNCGTGERMTLLELAAAAIDGAPGVEVAIEHVDVHRAGDIEHACADLSRLRQIGAPLPRWTGRDAVIDFISQSWARPGAASSAWDAALDELHRHGLTP